MPQTARGGQVPMSTLREIDVRKCSMASHGRPRRTPRAWLKDDLSRVNGPRPNRDDYRAAIRRPAWLGWFIVLTAVIGGLLWLGFWAIFGDTSLVAFAIGGAVAFGQAFNSAALNERERRLTQGT
jgi:hypothetical protein